ADLAVEEDATFVVADRERPDDTVLEQKRQRQDGPISYAAQALENRGVVPDAWIVGKVRRGDGAPLAHGQPDDSGPTREDGPGPQRLLPLAHERESRQVAGLGHEPVERSLPGVEQGPDAVHHAACDGAEIEGFAAQTAQLGQGL